MPVPLSRRGHSLKLRFVFGYQSVVVLYASVRMRERCYDGTSRGKAVGKSSAGRLEGSLEGHHDPGVELLCW